MNTIDQLLKWVEWFGGRTVRRGECLIYSGSKDDLGYGTIRADGRTRKTHRVCYELIYGPISDNQFVCHSCDTPSCVNPSHLWLGTHQDNQADKKRKGRARTRPRFGEENPASKLTFEQARYIKTSHESTKLMCEKFGVPDSTVQLIRQGKRWGKELQDV